MAGWAEPAWRPTCFGTAASAILKSEIKPILTSKQPYRLAARLWGFRNRRNLEAECRANLRHPVIEQLRPAAGQASKMLSMWHVREKSLDIVAHILICLQSTSLTDS